MSRPAGVLLLWGLFLAVLAAVVVVAFEPRRAETPALLGGAALVAVVVGLFVAARRLGRRELDAATVEPDVSPPTAWLAVGIAFAAVGAAVGLWLTLIGAGVAVVGAGGVVRELRAQRDAARDLERGRERT